MTSFLLITSFIIDGILILGLLILMTKIKKTEELELRHEQVADEIEDLFTSYLLELKEENNRMSEWIHTTQASSFNKRNLSKDNYSISPSSKERKEEGKSPLYGSPDTEQNETYAPSLPSKILIMKQNGSSIEEIARELDKGKTEVELLLKFNSKKLVKELE